MRTQKISSHVAPVIIERLRGRIKELQKENTDLKKTKTLAKKSTHKIQKILLRGKLGSQISDVLYRNYEIKRDAIYADAGLSHGVQMIQVEVIFQEYKKNRAIKIKLVDALFDFRKNQNIDSIKKEAEKIINS